MPNERGAGNGVASRATPDRDGRVRGRIATTSSPLHGDDRLGPNGRLIVVSNRGPITFELERGAPAGLTGDRGPGGLVTALAELGRHLPVSWVATALTPGDHVAAEALAGTYAGARVRRRPSSRSRPIRGERVRARIDALVRERLPGQDLRLHLVPLPDEIFEPYYRRVCNPFLWFVQHLMYAPAYGPNVDADLLDAWRNGYVPANERLAEGAVRAAARIRNPLVLLQDYHLYLAAARIRQRRSDATILHFTHIPWPPATVWQLLPRGMRRAICEGLLGADIVGLQTDRYASHFLDSVATFVPDAHVEPDGRSVEWRGRTIRVRSYPISVDPDGVRRVAGSMAVAERVERLEERLERVAAANDGSRPALIVRADRIEPSKNALRGFLAFEAMLVRRPELRDRVRFVAVQAPTRPGIAEYERYAAAVREVVARVNGLAEPDDQPIWLYDGSDYAMAIAALRRADVVLVNPIVDGMNLVAKEAALVGDRSPVLVLSETAGAAEQLAADALPVAPADIVGTASQLERGLAMSPDERRARAARLRTAVREQDISWWINRQLRDLAAIRRGAQPPSRRLRDTVRRAEPETV
ncbi:MAG TPA: trehalose-6-phosphate synthase [Candidatus Limnocylindrales bacterium]